MAAPTKTSRTTPVGIGVDAVYKDGYRCLIAFEENAAVKFWEKGIKPLGIDGGDNIEATTMHNNDFRTFGTPSLVTVTSGSVRVAYNAAVYNEIMAMINVEQAITIHFPLGAWVAFWGRLRSFEPDELVEGTQPEATIGIEPTNWDPSNQVEAGFAYGTT